MSEITEIQRHQIKRLHPARPYKCTANSGKCAEPGTIAIIYQGQWLGDVVCPKHDNLDGATSCTGVRGLLDEETLSTIDPTFRP